MTRTMYAPAEAMRSGDLLRLDGRTYEVRTFTNDGHTVGVQLADGAEIAFAPTDTVEIVRKQRTDELLREIDTWERLEHILGPEPEKRR